MSFSGASKKCGACQKSIYPNDPSLSMGDKSYHKSCSKCSTCNGQLTIKNFATSGDRLLCKTHFMKEFHEIAASLGTFPPLTEAECYEVIRQLGKHGTDAKLR